MDSITRDLAEAAHPTSEYASIPTSLKNCVIDEPDGILGLLPQNPKATDWPDPLPFVGHIALEEYPLAALPDGIRAAVEEVQAYVQAPSALVASSALAALSLAVQALVDVERSSRLQGPSGMFFLTIADSGERKTTCDRFFMGAIREFENTKAEAAKPELAEYKSALAAWEAKCAGVKEKIRTLARDRKSTQELEADLDNLERDKPKEPRIPRLLYADATSEAIARGLTRWPSAGLVSSEAGLVLGSHSMSRDSRMRTLSLLNQLWDGQTVSVDRISSESFMVRGARLTMALQTQEPTVREFLRDAGDLARGTGFLARCLLAWPESTQGKRLYVEPPQHWPHLAAFHRKIAAFLNRPIPMDETCALKPAVLLLTPDAKEAWIEFYNAIERELGKDGELHSIRDVASKAADNAARLAALFQLFEHGMGAVSLDSFDRASRIVAWHLSEARRFFEELAMPQELAEAARLEKWLIAYCDRQGASQVSHRDVQRLGPIRQGERLSAALHELAEHGRARIIHEGNRKHVAINPALIRGHA